MENLFYNISQVLGITIVHSLWQGLIIYIALRVFMLLMPRVQSAVKYRVACAALAGTLCWFIYTLFTELGHYNWLSASALQIAPITLPAIFHSVSAPANRYYITIAGYMPYLTMLYVVGLVFNTLKLSLAWNSIYRIRQNSSNAGFEGTVKRLAAKLNLKKTVQSAFNEWVDVPCITGFIKPVILLPLSITCYLNTEEIEAILLHELAHIKRNDYLLNFIQQVIGIVLFFNPFARLVNKIINEERENCCDDIVVHVTGSPFIYAQALLKLEENKQHQWQLALAATGKKYELLHRIERIMKTNNETINIRPVLITLLALTCSISSIAWLNPEIKDGKLALKNITPAMRLISSAITTNSTVVVPAIKPEITVVPTPVYKKDIVIDDNGPSIFTTPEDTAKNKKLKYKIVIEDDKGNKKEYNSIADMPAEDRDEFYKNNGDDFHFKVADSAHHIALRKFSVDDQALAMTRKFDSPEWKKKQAELEKLDEEISKKINSPEWKKKQEEMEKKAMELSKKFDTPEWRKKQEELSKQAEFMRDSIMNDPKFKVQIEEMKKLGEEMRKAYDGTEWKQQEKKKLDEEVRTAWKQQQKTYEVTKTINEDGKEKEVRIKIKKEVKAPRPPRSAKPDSLKTERPAKVAKPAAKPKPTPKPQMPL